MFQVSTLDILKMCSKDWRGDSEVKINCCICRGPGFNFQRPRGGSQPSVTQFPRHQMPSSELNKHQAVHTIHIHTYKQNTHMNKIKLILKKKI